jgi:hypothetical protein
MNAPEHARTLPEPEIKRPPSVTAVGILFVGAGLIGFFYHLLEITGPIQPDEVLVLGLRILAVVGGFFVLRGANWARWLLILWMAIHVMISIAHSVSELVVHAVLFGVTAYVLLRSQATLYFREESHSKIP